MSEGLQPPPRTPAAASPILWDRPNLLVVVAKRGTQTLPILPLGVGEAAPVPSRATVTRWPQWRWPVHQKC